MQILVEKRARLYYIRLVIMELSIQKLILSSMHQFSDNTAVMTSDETITYSELYKKSVFIAKYLQEEFSIQKNDIVAIHINNSVELIIILCGVLFCGATYLPIDCCYPMKRKLHMIKNANAKLLIHDTDLDIGLDEIKNLSLSEVDFHECIAGCMNKLSNISYSTNDILYVLYTSGSTGLPKGVPLRQIGILNMLLWYIKEYKMGDSDINYIFSSFGYDLTQKNILSSLIVGGTIFLDTRNFYSPKEIINELEKFSATIINCTPSAFYPILDFVGDLNRLSSLRWIFLGGEKINCKKLNSLISLYPKTQLVNTYGPTECSDLACCYKATAAELASLDTIPLGYALPEVKIFVLDENMNLVDRDQKGEVYLAGMCLGNGYIGLPEESQKKFIEDLPDFLKSDGINRLYRVGDICYWDDLGRLNYVGRIDDQVKIRGNRVELLEIDRAIESSHFIQQSVTVMTENNDDKLLVSFCITKNNISEKTIKKYLIDTLPSYMIPHRIHFVEIYPKTPNSKIDKIKLKELAKELICVQ
jgi:amino acid adenylation domain-containing protein